MTTSLASELPRCIVSCQQHVFLSWQHGSLPLAQYQQGTLLPVLIFTTTHSVGAMETALLYRVNSHINAGIVASHAYTAQSASRCLRYHSTHCLSPLSLRYGLARLGGMVGSFACRLTKCPTGIGLCEDRQGQEFMTL